MLIWINGAFGAGKSSVAQELCRRFPRAMPFDPEQIGFMLRRMVPARDRPSDFQAMPSWRRLVVATAADFSRSLQRPLIVPMTLVHPAYFDEVMKGLAEAGVEVHHFTLMVSPRTLRLRLLKRWSTPQSKLWTLRQVSRCVSEVADPKFSRHIQADGRTVREVGDEISSCLPELAMRKLAQPGR